MEQPTFFSEFLSPEELKAIYFSEAYADEENNEFRTQILEPVIKVLKTPEGRKKYIQLGTDFINSNAEMLAAQYPTTPVSYPRQYVDDLFKTFGFDKAEFRNILKSMAKDLQSSSAFSVLLNGMTNVFHAVALFYSDIITDRKLRDSGRQQIGITTYGHIYRRYWPQGFLNTQVMEYTYGTLNRTWTIVQCESVVNWIYHQIEVAYGKFRSELTLDMNFGTMVAFINRCWSTMNQAAQLLANKYYANLDNKSIGGDVKGNEMSLTTRSHSQLRDNLVRMISQGDSLYKNKGELYKGTARSKNVKTEDLYAFAQKIDKSDIKWIIDMILYVFLVKENHKIDQINTNEYIKRINNFPTAVDRAVAGKPVILPLMKKYKEKDMIVKSYICLLATYILLRLNDARPENT